MVALADIRAAIVAKLEGVANIGAVNDYERYTVDLKDFKAFFVSSGKVRGWTIRRISKRVISPALGEVKVTNHWRIAGYFSFEDAKASEKTFDDLVEAVMAAFLADETLGGVVGATVDDDDGTAALQLDDSGPVMFAGVLCHSARLTLKTIHWE